MTRANRYGLETVTTWGAAGRLRVVGLAVGSAAVAAMVIVGCSNVTQGAAKGNASDAPDYRTSVSKSMKSSSSSSSARESAKRAAAVADAVNTSCSALVDGSKKSIEAVNAYVAAFNQNSPDQGALIGPAVASLNSGADQVAGSLSALLPSDLTSALNGWVDSARRLANILPNSSGPDQFNAAADEVEAAKKAALSACKAAS